MNINSILIRIKKILKNLSSNKANKFDKKKLKLLLLIKI